MTMASILERINFLYAEALKSRNRPKMKLLTEFERHLPLDENVPVPKVIYLQFESHYENNLLIETMNELGYEVDSKSNNCATVTSQ